MSENKVYLGDGAYVEWTGYSYILTAENGIRVSDTVHIDVADLQSLFNFIADKQNLVINIETKPSE